MTIFSLTVVVMIVSIIRVTIVGTSTKNPDISWLYFWSNIEMSTGMHISPSSILSLIADARASAIVISCIASFRHVFVNAQNRRRQVRPGGTSSRKTLLSWLRLPRWGSRKSRASGKKASDLEEGKESSEDGRSTIHVTPLQSIHVDPTLSVTASNFRLEDY